MAESGKGLLDDFFREYGTRLHFAYIGIVGDESEAKLFVGDKVVARVEWDHQVLAEQNIVAFLTDMAGKCDRSLGTSVVVVRPKPYVAASDLPGFRVQ